MEARKRKNDCQPELLELMDRNRKRFSKASRQQELMWGWKDEQKEVGTACSFKVSDLKQATTVII